MTFRTIGALPGVQLHPGLVAALYPLDIRLRELNNQSLSIQAQAEAAVTVDPGFLDVAQNTFTGFIDADVALTAEVDILEAKLDVIADMEADLRWLAGVSARLSAMLGRLQAAIDVSQVHAWSYDGASSQFAPKLTRATANGFGYITPDQEIRAAIFATSSPANWATFSGAVYTGWGGGSVATKDSQGLATGELRFLGAIPGGTLLAQAALAGPQVSAEITAVAEAIADITANLALLATVNILGISVGAAAALGAAASLLLPLPSVDLTFEFDASAVVSLEPVVLALQASINGAGIHLWSYEGLARDFGREFAQQTSRGIAGPPDRSMGLVIATDSIEDWDNINRVLRVK